MGNVYTLIKGVMAWDYAFDKTQQSIHNAKNDSDVNSGLIITYQYLFINCNKCTRLRQNVNNRGE